MKAVSKTKAARHEKITTCALLAVLAAACAPHAHAEVPEGELNSLYIRPEVQLPAPALTFPNYPVVDDCTTGLVTP
ncbi:hypothetical protein RAA17_00940 [Komagataeibacter rhaeticus]|nr:hypothetical protein [Komagataeibacter rhaeticus]